MQYTPTVTTLTLRFMMYGFGDDPCPYTQSIALIEDIVLNYINDISIRSVAGYLKRT